MKRTLAVVVLVVGVGCNGVGGGVGGGVASVGRGELRQVRADLSLRAPSVAPLQHARAERLRLGLTARDDFAILKIEPDQTIDHVRLQQLHAGVKVWGADVVLHAHHDGTSTLSGNLVTAIDGVDPTPGLSAEAAQLTARADYSQKASAPSSLAFARESAELVLLPAADRTTRLAWHVQFFTELQAGLNPGLWHYFVDAHDGRIVGQWNALHTLVEASGPGGNTKVARQWMANLDVETGGAGYVMNTTKVETTDMKHATSGIGTVASSASLTFADAAINDAHGFAETTLKMLSEWLGYNSIDDQGYKILSRVHYSTNYQNAFWDGTQMTYGDGGNVFYQMSGSLDVVAHEIDHGFTSAHADLQYVGQSGGMNESFSDIAGTTAKFYAALPGASFDLGTDIFKRPGALRYMCTPAKDGQSIDNASDYNSQLDVHFSSGVMNKAFCLAAKRISSGSPTGTPTADGVKQAAKAWFTANAKFWTSTSTFAQGAQGVVDAAKSLNFPVKDIQAIGDSWKDVGVTSTYPIVNEFLLSLDAQSKSVVAGKTASFQIATSVPSGSTAQTVMLTLSGTDAGVTGSFSLASLQSGGSSQLTLTVGADVAAGKHDFTLTAAGASASHTLTGTLMVQSAAAPPPTTGTPGSGGGDGAGAGGGSSGDPTAMPPSDPNAGKLPGGCEMGGSSRRTPGILVCGFLLIALLRRRRAS